MTANVEVARQAEAPGAVISRGPGEPLKPRQTRRQRDAILIVTLLAAAANLALQQGATFVIVLAAIRGLVRESQPIRRALSWYFGPVSTGHRQGLVRKADISRPVGKGWLPTWPAPCGVTSPHPDRARCPAGREEFQHGGIGSDGPRERVTAGAGAGIQNAGAGGFSCRTILRTKRKDRKAYPLPVKSRPSRRARSTASARVETPSLA
jgi:hypothetical protein